MIDLPYVIEAPDLVIIEVLEALPGRPIMGEHLVRPDGTVCLGYYGDVHIQGLTLRQAKVKIIQHLRRILNDDLLRLRVPRDPSGDEAAEEIELPLPPVLPRADAIPDGEKPDPGPHVQPAQPARPRRRARDARPRQRPGTNSMRKASPTKARDDDKKQAAIPPTVPAEVPPAAIGPGGEAYIHVPPEDSSAVYVDISSYNSKFYHVEGDAPATGRYPITGRETVLDALESAGGFMSTADPTNIRLIRPARGGKKAHIYPIDFKAIVEKGDKTANLQVFPGDRLVVGRDPIVKTTIAVDRAEAPIHTVVNSMLRASSLENALFPSLSQPKVLTSVQIGGLRWSVEAAGKGRELTAAQREETIKAWVEFWSKMAAQAGGANGNDAFLREALLRHLTPVAPAPVENRK